MSDRELLLECFRVIYQIYRDQHAMRKRYQPVSLYPTLSKLQKRLEESMARVPENWRDYTMEVYAEDVSPASARKKVNSPWRPNE
jgi:hypothetical protein